MKKLLLMALLVACGGAQRTTTETTAQPAPEPEPTPVAESTEQDPMDVSLEGDHLAIHGFIHFESDSDVILSDSTELLDHIALFVQHHGEISHLRIIGHTDASGGPEHNQDLSDRRAAAVAAALTSRGVTIPLDHAGVGESQPLCHEDTDACHDQNRRVEFIIVPN